MKKRLSLLFLNTCLLRFSVLFLLPKVGLSVSDFSPTEPLSAETMKALDIAIIKLNDARKEAASVIFGQDQAILDTLTALVSGGHILLIGLPGVAKTRLVMALAKVLGLESRRIQCTPDLMPSDVIGAEVLEEGDYGKRAFRFVQGPVFSQFLMVDEINRTSPRTQAALLQAMQERRVTVAGREHALPSPFHVLATQNPLEQEGIYPLPEAQLDRFLLQIDMDYPSREAEKMMLQTTVMQTADTAPRTILYAQDLKDCQALVRQMPVADKIIEAILTLVREGRPHGSSLPIVKDYVAWGPGPRASQALALCIRARALLDGRLAPTFDDLRALIRPVLQHRMSLNFRARADGVAMKDVLNALIQTIPA